MTDHPLDGATIVLTGATSGIGRAAAPLLAERAGHLVLHGRQDETQAAGVLREARARLRPGARLDYLIADLADPTAVARLAQGIRDVTERVDVLINNAGRAGPHTRKLAPTGHEVTLQTNYLAPVALTEALLDHIGRDRLGRVVNVASATHYSVDLRLDDLDMARQAYSASTAYARTKLALVAWSCWLAAHRPSPSVDIVSMHPGVISTRLLHEMFSIKGDRPERAAAALVEVASRRGDNGTYYDGTTPALPSAEASDPATQARLREVTLTMLAETGGQEGQSGSS
jgi:NAD(P)-dependent dehydrogenase (short-subunit alcohol dehydrogenase family)